MIKLETGQSLALSRVRDLQDQWTDKQDDREYARKLHEMYEGDWASQIPSMPDEPTRDNYKPAQGISFLSHIIEKLSFLYDIPPHRRFEEAIEEKSAKEKLHDFERRLDTAIHAGDKLSRLHGNSLIRLHYKPKSWESASYQEWALGVSEESPLSMGESDGIQTLAIPRHHFEILTPDHDPLTPIAVVEEVGSSRVRDLSRHRNDGKKFVKVHHYWDDTYFIRLVDWKVEEISPGVPAIVKHGFGCIPYVSVRNDESCLDYYCPGLGGRDMHNTLLQIGQLIKEYLWSAKTQRGQPTASGLKKDQQLVLSPENIIKTGDGGDFKIVPNQANLGGMLDAINNALGWVLVTSGLPSNMFTIVASSAQSGVAMAMERSDLQDERTKREKLGRHWEEQVHVKGAKIYNASRKTAYTWKLSDVQYSKADPVTSTGERQKRITYQLDVGLMSPVQAIMELYPGMPREEAERRFVEASEWRDKYSTVAITADTQK